MKKRCIAILLSLVMTVSLVPVNSYAIENGKQVLSGYETQLSEAEASGSQRNENETKEVDQDTEIEVPDSNYQETEAETMETKTTETATTEEATSEDNLGQTEEAVQESNFTETEETEEIKETEQIEETEQMEDTEANLVQRDSEIDNKKMEEERAASANIIPYILNPERETDNLEQLTAGSAVRNAGVGLLDYGYPKYFWINRFGQTPEEDYLEWTVQSNLEQTESYYVWMHLDASAGTNFKLEVIQGNETSETIYMKPAGGWEVTEFGEIQIPRGTSRIRFTKESNDKTNCQIKGIDMIRSSDKESYEQRINQYFMDGSQAKLKFSESGYGLFFSVRCVGISPIW